MHEHQHHASAQRTATVSRQTCSSHHSPPEVRVLTTFQWPMLFFDLHFSNILPHLFRLYPLQLYLLLHQVLLHLLEYHYHLIPNTTGNTVRLSESFGMHGSARVSAH